MKATRDPSERHPGASVGDRKCVMQRPRSPARRAACAVCPEQIASLCAEEAAAQEQTGQVEECLKVNLLKIKTEGCKKVTPSVSVFCRLRSSPLPLLPLKAIDCASQW